MQGLVGFEMVGLTPDFQVNYTLLWVNQGKDLANYNDVDGFLGLGSMETSRDYIDQAFKNNYIQVRSSVGRGLMFLLGESFFVLFGS